MAVLLYITDSAAIPGNRAEAVGTSSAVALDCKGLLLSCHEVIAMQYLQVCSKADKPAHAVWHQKQLCLLCRLLRQMTVLKRASGPSRTCSVLLLRRGSGGASSGQLVSNPHCLGCMCPCCGIVIFAEPYAYRIVHKN